MPRPRRLTGLITLNETQLAGGASGARAEPDPRGYQGLPWPCPGVLAYHLPGPGWGHHELRESQSGQLGRQMTFGAVQPGRPRDGRSLRPKGHRIPSAHGDTKAQTDRTGAMEPRGWLWTG